MTCCTARSATPEPRAFTPVKVKGTKPAPSIESQVPWPAPGPSAKPAPRMRTRALLIVTGEARR
jgi:hypothetical protein